MIGGTNVKTFPAPPLPTLGEIAEGTLVKMNESGAPVEFYVAKHDYESELNGAGRTLMVRKDVYDQRVWSSNVNAWSGCAIMSWLNSTYKALLDTNIQNIMGTTEYYYTPGNRLFNVKTQDSAIFLLSLTELGESHSYAKVEGSTLPIANTLKIAYQNSSATPQWTRSPYAYRYSTKEVWFIGANGDINFSDCTDSYGSRPCFTLPSTVLVDEAMNIVA